MNQNENNEPNLTEIQLNIIYLLIRYKYIYFAHVAQLRPLNEMSFIGWNATSFIRSNSIYACGFMEMLVYIWYIATWHVLRGLTWLQLHCWVVFFINWKCNSSNEIKMNEWWCFVHILSTQEMNTINLIPKTICFFCFFHLFVHQPTYAIIFVSHLKSETLKSNPFFVME